MPFSDKEKKNEYHRNWEVKFGKVKRRERKLKYKKLTERIKNEIGCEHCGWNKNPLALQFHHINKKDKEFSISRGLTHRLLSLLKETEKCLVLCANCHIIEEYRLNDKSLY